MRWGYMVSLLVCSMGTAWGAPWNSLDENSYVSNKPEKSLSKLVSKTLLPQLLERKEPLRYCIEGTPDPDKYAASVERVYTEWFASTARMIRQAKRSEEFADLLPLLEKPLRFERQACSYNAALSEMFHPNMEETYWETNFASQPEQLRLVVLPKEMIEYVCTGSEHGEIIACAASPTLLGMNVLAMSRVEESDQLEWWSSFLHETGHTLGMGEGYALGAVKNNPFFGSASGRKSVMRGQTKEDQAFSCDDADAVIAFVDASSFPGKPARTGKTARAFKSLCADDPIWFVDGRQQNRPPRATGDASRFVQTSYQADGRVNQFSVFKPLAKGFSSAFRLHEALGVPSSVSGDLTSFQAADGRSFAVETLEDSSSKRIFTLRDKYLLGETWLEFSSDSVQASTTLDVSKKERLARVEKLQRGNNDKYGTYFVYAIFEGVARDGVLHNSSARIVYVFKDWMIVSEIPAGHTKVTTFLLESNSGGGQRMQVYQGYWDQYLAGGGFAVSLTDIQPIGELSDRDKKYLAGFSSGTEEGMQDELRRATGVPVSQLGKQAVAEDISNQDVAKWVGEALTLHARVGRVLQNQFDSGLFSSRQKGKAYPEFQTRFRPAPFMPKMKRKS